MRFYYWRVRVKTLKNEWLSWNTWKFLITIKTKISASDGYSGDYFGCSVSMSADGNSLIISAYGDEGNSNSFGSVYTYKWNGSSWDEAKIFIADATLYSKSGCNISMSGDGNRVVIGVVRDNGGDSGSVYVCD